MSSPHPPLAGSPIVLRPGNFPIQIKLVHNQMAQFGQPGLEVIDGISRRPEEPLEFLPFVEPNGNRTSRFELNDSRTRLSPIGREDFVFARTQYAAARALYVKQQTALMQFLLNSLSPESFAVLDLTDAFQALKLTCDTMGLWQLIVRTHMGESGRSKQFSLQQFLQWKQVTTMTVSQNLAKFRDLR